MTITCQTPRLIPRGGMSSRSLNCPAGPLRAVSGSGGRGGGAGLIRRAVGRRVSNNGSGSGRAVILVGLAQLVSTTTAMPALSAIRCINTLPLLAEPTTAIGRSLTIAFAATPSSLDSSHLLRSAVTIHGARAFGEFGAASCR